MTVPIHVVDAFTDRPFAGNPAAICLLDLPADAAWMQAVAAEMNLSETAFLVPGDDAAPVGPRTFGLRWFTPTVEVDLCGHATLASAHVVFTAGMAPLDAPVHFDTRSGRLVCRRVGEQIEMDFPAVPLTPVEPPPDLLPALGLDHAVTVAEAGHWYFVEVESAAQVRAAAPDLRALATIGGGGATLTAAADTPEADFVSRVFGPGVGIDEDPVTGSAHCGLAPFWADRVGRNELVGHQVSARGGIVRCRVEGDRVFLRGDAVTVLSGELHADPVGRPA
jgi:PhzF family phenazine biosynthesis protein